MATPYTWRPGTEPATALHFDVGNFPTNADITDARQFAVLECWFDPRSAALRAVAYNSGLTPPASWIAPNNSQGTKPKPK